MAHHLFLPSSCVTPHKVTTTVRCSSSSPTSSCYRCVLSYTTIHFLPLHRLEADTLACSISLINALGFGSRSKKSYSKKTTPSSVNSVARRIAMTVRRTLSESMSSRLPPTRRILSRYNFPRLGSSGAFLNTVAYMSEANTSE